MTVQAIKNSMKLDFIVVGAEKCGTTWLADMFKQHPQIFLPEQKELHYFNRKFVEFPDLDNYNYDKPIEWYWSFFKNAPATSIKGEICPAYLWDEKAAQRIFDFDPNIKILIILRNPLERTFSAYRFYMQRGVVHHELRVAVEKFHELLRARSLYYDQVKRYLDIFPSQNVCVILYDELKVDSAKVLTGVEKFLNVDEYIPSNVNERSYVTGVVRFRLLNRVLARVRYFFHRNRLSFLLDLGRWVGVAGKLEQIRQENKVMEEQTELNQLREDDRKWLNEYFREDVEKLEKMISKDLAAWK